MKKYEVLSPVGNIKNFYTAIKSGADAVYLGLPKFNARMKADNITLADLPELIRYAHLKNVQVYITLNTLLTQSEILSAVDMVGECLLSGVDAFIVQDLGLISVLRTTYPGITLHGSTQLGVHNVRGARVAKSLGLNRVVLSRECTLRDIEDIASNVDIELEVFVQGAMCVCFSGNCYMSSLKHNASGNRGECKQLCRLSYTLDDNCKSLSGYTLSPRDNCMLDCIPELCDLGVTSFKIEGRLRHSGYVGVATNVYREAIDHYISGEHYDTDSARDKLSRVFSRGDYISGYNDSNNIIDSVNNNHMGVNIGKCLSSTKFKDIYRITIQSSTPINSGDGLKFVSGREALSMGVGNVEKNGNNYVVYGKNYVSAGSIVYKSLDIDLENNVIDYSSKRHLSIYIEALAGNKLYVRYSVDDISVEEYGPVCEVAKSAPLSEDSIKKTFAKVDREFFDIDSIEVVTDGVFVVVSQMNDLRRKVVSRLETLLLSNQDLIRKSLPEITSYNDDTLDSYAIVNETTDISKLQDYTGLIFSPLVYSCENIRKFESRYKKYFDSPLIINLPIISRVDDMPMIDSIVDEFGSGAIFVANNVYALDYKNVRLWAGAGLNIVNDYALSEVKRLGCERVIGSVEKWCGRTAGTLKLSSNVLMTLAHCPYKTLYANDCVDCRCNNSLTLKSNNSSYRIVRQKISNCYFELIENRPVSNGAGIVSDLR